MMNTSTAPSRSQQSQRYYNVMQSVPQNCITALTHWVLVCKYSQEDLSALKNYILLEVYYYIDRIWDTHEDDAGDFLLSIHDKILGLVNRYKYYGIPFDNYLKRYVHMQYKSFKKSKISYNIKDNVTYLSEQHHTNTYAEYQIEPKSMPSPTKMIAHMIRLMKPKKNIEPFESRRMVVVALKLCAWISKEDMLLVARLSGTPHHSIVNMCEKLRCMLEPHQQRFQRLSNRRNALYGRLLSMQYKMSTNYDTHLYNILSKETFVLKEKLLQINKLLLRVRQCPSNTEVALVSGIPKGTIDSILFALKRKESFRAAANCPVYTLN